VHSNLNFGQAPTSAEFMPLHPSRAPIGHRFSKTLAELSRGAGHPQPTVIRQAKRRVVAGATAAKDASPLRAAHGRTSELRDAESVLLMQSNEVRGLQQPGAAFGARHAAACRVSGEPGIHAPICLGEQTKILDSW